MFINEQGSGHSLVIIGSIDPEVSSRSYAVPPRRSPQLARSPKSRSLTLECDIRPLGRESGFKEAATRFRGTGASSRAVMHVYMYIGAGRAADLGAASDHTCFVSATSRVYPNPLSSHDVGGKDAIKDLSVLSLQLVGTEARERPIRGR